MSSNAQAMTAEGSEPVDPSLNKAQQADPHVDIGPQIPIGTDGKPQASGQAGAWKPGLPRWVPTTVPDVKRKAPGEK